MKLKALKCSYPNCKMDGFVVSEKDPTPLCDFHSNELSQLIDTKNARKIISFMLKCAPVNIKNNA